MLRTVSDGQSIHQYIPPNLRRMFYKNPTHPHAINNGLDPYGFSTNGLVLYLPLWALNNGATNSIQSVDAYRHTCAITGALWQPDGRLFDGNDDYIRVPNHASLNFGTGNFSLLAWFYTTYTAANQEILCKFKNGAPYTGYGLLVNVTSSFLAFAVNETVAYSATGDIDTTDGKWHLGGGTFEAGAVNGMKVFLDGVEDVSAREDAPAGDKDTTNDLLIGVAQDSTSYNIKGTLGEVWIYNRLLSAGEVLRNYNATCWRY